MHQELLCIQWRGEKKHQLQVHQELLFVKKRFVITNIIVYFFKNLHILNNCLKAPPQPQPQPPQQPKPEPMLPAIPVPSTSHPLHHHHPPPPSSNNNNNNTLTLSPTALYGSTQKMWTTEMLSDNFNSLLPSIKPRTPSSAPPFSGFT